jgi:hypothetical protein
LDNKAGPTRLGFAVLLKMFERDGRFPRSRQDVAGVVVVHLAKQVGVPADQYVRYDWSCRAIKYHRAQIRAFLGFREATVGIVNLRSVASDELPQNASQRASVSEFLRGLDDLVPGARSVRQELSPSRRRNPVAACAKVIADRTERTQEPLGMFGRFEPPHQSLTLARWLV